MPTIEEQITKTEERLAQLKEEHEERVRKISERAERGPAARVMNEIASAVRIIGRTIKICDDRFDKDEGWSAAKAVLEDFQDQLLEEWRSGYKHKQAYCEKVGDNAEIERLYKPEEFASEYGVE
jgi:hypothetical protein